MFEAIAMAVRDFNKVLKASSRWTLNLRARSSASTSLEAIGSLMSELVHYAPVAVIAGTSSSTLQVTAPFLGHFGIPIVTPYVQDKAIRRNVLYPSFFRACPSDSNVDSAVKDLLHYFGWRRFCFVHSDLLGTHFVRNIYANTDIYSLDLIRVLRLHYTHGVNKNALGKQKFTSTLRQQMELLRDECRVIVANVHPSDLLPLFRVANELGMLAEGYAWILTRLFRGVQLLDVELQSYLSGALVLRPKVKEEGSSEDMEKRNSDVEDAAGEIDLLQFIGQLCQFSPGVCPGKSVDTFNMAAVYAYNSALFLGDAIDEWIASGGGEMPTCRILSDVFGNGSLSLYMKDPPLDKLILERVNSSLIRAHYGMDRNSTNYDVYNVIGGQMKHVGWWNSSSSEIVGIELFNLVGKHPTIVWPGNTSVMPFGASSINQTLHALVFDSPPFALSERLDNGSWIFTGVAVDLLRNLSSLYGLTLNLTAWHAINNTGSMDDMLDMVASDESAFDMGVGGITKSAPRLHHSNFSASFYQTGFSLLVRAPIALPQSYWYFVKSYDGVVWLCIALTFLLSAMVMLVLDGDAVRKSKAKYLLFDVVIFALKSFVRIHKAPQFRTGCGRLFFFVTQFVLIIIIAVYTANMVRLLRARNTIVMPIKGWNDLFAKRIACLDQAWHKDICKERFHPSWIVFPRVPDIDTGLRLLQKGKVDALIATTPVAEQAAVEHCDVIIVGKQVSDVTILRSATD